MVVKAKQNSFYNSVFIFHFHSLNSIRRRIIQASPHRAVSNANRKLNNGSCLSYKDDDITDADGPRQRDHAQKRPLSERSESEASSLHELQQEKVSVQKEKL